jgi:hypothetical protein
VRRAVAVVLALLGGALVVITVGAFVISTFCWEYCEPEDAPTFWDGLKFALPFGVAALGLTMIAVTLFMGGGGSWVGGLLVAIGACVGAALLFWGVAALYEPLGSGVVSWVVGIAVTVAWVEGTALVARRVAGRS